MTTNQASGGVRRSSERRPGRRQNSAENGTAPPPLRRGRRTTSSNSAFDRCPGRDPLVVRDAALAAVGAGRDRRLPELDGVEVGARGVGVVLGTRARLKRLHLRAGQRVDGGLAEAQRLLG